jgi:hypothetical protein
MAASIFRPRSSQWQLKKKAPALGLRRKPRGFDVRKIQSTLTRMNLVDRHADQFRTIVDGPVPMVPLRYIKLSIGLHGPPSPGGDACRDSRRGTGRTGNLTGPVLELRLRSSPFSRCFRRASPSPSRTCQASTRTDLSSRLSRYGTNSQSRSWIPAISAANCFRSRPGFMSDKSHQGEARGIERRRRAFRRPGLGLLSWFN